MSSCIFIAGGGTGGHVYPALAIADALVENGICRSRDDVHFVGSARGIEAQVVPSAGYSITLLPGRGIARKVSVQSAKAVLSLCLATVKAFSLLREQRPRLVVSVGGYAAAPAAFAAVALRIPVVIAESNAVPGAVNRVLGRFASAAAIAWPGTRLPHATVTGNPVRASVAEVKRTVDRRRAAKVELGFSADLPLVVVAGGSLGARQINRAVAQLPAQWSAAQPASLLHIVGRRDFDDPAMRASSSGSLTVRAVAYEEWMERVYGAADVMICRAGATTVSELTAAAVPAILVPLPNSPGDHQTANARLLESAGASVVVPDAKCTAPELQKQLLALLGDEDRLHAMERSARQLAKPDAANAVADVIRSVLARVGRKRLKAKHS